MSLLLGWCSYPPPPAILPRHKASWAAAGLEDPLPHNHSHTNTLHSGARQRHHHDHCGTLNSFSPFTGTDVRYLAAHTHTHTHTPLPHLLSSLPSTICGLDRERSATDTPSQPTPGSRWGSLTALSVPARAASYRIPVRFCRSESGRRARHFP